MELLGVDPNIPVDIRRNVRCAGWWWERLPDFTKAFPRVRCKRRDVNQSDDVRLIPCLRDDDAALRMADEQNRSLLLCDHLSSSLSIIKQ